MANKLIFDQELPETFLEVDGQLSGIKATLSGLAASHGYHDIASLEANWLPKKQVSRLVWPKLFRPQELTLIFFALGPRIVYDLQVFETTGLLDQRQISIENGQLWDESLLAKLAYPGQFFIPEIASLDSVFARNEYLKPAAQQCKVVDVTGDNVIYYWLRSRQLPNQPFENWVAKQPERHNCPWYNEIQAEKAKQKEAEEARRKAEEARKQQSRQKQIAMQNPKAILKLAPDCPDWLVEIYWKALVKAIHPDRHNGSANKAKLNRMLAAANEAHDKIKEQRGAAWEPAKVPWLAEKEK